MLHVAILYVLYCYQLWRNYSTHVTTKRTNTDGRSWTQYHWIQSVAPLRKKGEFGHIASLHFHLIHFCSQPLYIDLYTRNYIYLYIFVYAIIHSAQGSLPVLQSYKYHSPTELPVISEGLCQLAHRLVREGDEHTRLTLT